MSSLEGVGREDTDLFLCALASVHMTAVDPGGGGGGGFIGFKRTPLLLIEQ